jgi:hypothetical protein
VVHHEKEIIEFHYIHSESSVELFDP